MDHAYYLRTPHNIEDGKYTISYDDGDQEQLHVGNKSRHFAFSTILQTPAAQSLVLQRDLVVFKNTLLYLFGKKLFLGHEA